MGFKCKEFKEIADNLPNFKSLPNEGRYRTAVGRYYYYTFLTVRDVIYEVDKREDVEKYYSSGLIHSFIRIYLYKLSEYFSNISQKELITSIEKELKKYDKMFKWSGVINESCLESNSNIIRIIFNINNY